MKTREPRFTDRHRWPDAGYSDWLHTDIRRTFERARSRLPAQADPLDPQTWAEHAKEREPALDHNRK